MIFIPINYVVPVKHWSLLVVNTLEKSITYANLRKPLVINNLESQFAIQDRREVYRQDE